MDVQSFLTLSVLALVLTFNLCLIKPSRRPHILCVHSMNHIRGDVHTQFITQSVTFLVQPTHAPLKILGVTKIFFVVKHPTLDHCKQSNCKKRPSYYTMKTLFDQNRNITIKITKPSFHEWYSKLLH